MNTCPGASRIILPSLVMPGHIPCVKKNTSFGSSPKKPFSMKHATVAALFASLVITYHGIAAP